MKDQKVKASRMIATSVGLVTNNDYIQATEQVKNIFDKGTFQDGGFAYSIFYVFFEQYLIIGQEAAILIAGSFAAVTVMCYLFIANIGVTLLTSSIVVFTMVDILGLMTAWGIDLNAVSVANCNLFFKH